MLTTKKIQKGTRGTGIIDVEYLPSLSFKTYTMFLCLVFFATGFMLLLFCFFSGVNPFLVEGMIGNPFLYMGLGFICFFCYIFNKVSGFTL